MKRNFAPILVLFFPLAVSAQIYRCETPQGIVFSDKECGSEASVVELAEESHGLGGGPSEEVREYLEQKRQERAEARELARQFAPSQPSSAPVVQSQPVETVALLPGYLRPVRPGRPGVKPRPRPLPERPTRPGPGSGDTGGATVIRPQRGDGY